MSGDLFGYEPPKRAVAAGEVALVMVLHHQTDAAWLLGRDNDRQAAQWIPKSQCKRGVGRDENVWTMPRGMADERGWL